MVYSLQLGSTFLHGQLSKASWQVHLFYDKPQNYWETGIGRTDNQTTPQENKITIDTFINLTRQFFFYLLQEAYSRPGEMVQGWKYLLEKYGDWSSDHRTQVNTWWMWWSTCSSSLRRQRQESPWADYENSWISEPEPWAWLRDYLSEESGRSVKVESQNQPRGSPTSMHTHTCACTSLTHASTYM